MMSVYGQQMDRQYSDQSLSSSANSDSGTLFVCVFQENSC